MIKKCTFFAAGIILSGSILYAQPGMEKMEEIFKPQVRKVYLSTGFDGNILSTALSNNNDVNISKKFTTPRFTKFFNIGFNIHYNFNNNIGFFTGVNVKNIGFIEKSSVNLINEENLTTTTKRRVYTFGIPLGLKLGNTTKGNFLMLGGGVDFPFNYKEKTFVKRNDKEKFNEWFSQRTPAVMPYLFAGYNFSKGLFLKVNYYPTNFLNKDYTENLDKNTTIKPYSNYDVNLLSLSFGFNIPFSPKW